MSEMAEAIRQLISEKGYSEESVRQLKKHLRLLTNALMEMIRTQS